MGSFLHLMCSCTIKLEHLPPVNLVQALASFPGPPPPPPPRLRLWTCTIKLEHLPPVTLMQHDPKLQQCNSTTVGIKKLFRENVVWPLKGSSLQINHERLPPQQLQQHHTTTTSCNCSFKSFHHVQGKKTTARFVGDHNTCGVKVN